MTCSLYRFFDADDRLLYVGITTSGSARLAQHSRDKEWFSTVSRATFEHFATREDALAAEKAAIKAERPAYNLRHSLAPPVPPGYLSIPEAAAYMRVDADVLTRWVEAGYVPTSRRANKVVIRTKAIDDLLRNLRSSEAVA